MSGPATSSGPSGWTDPEHKRAFVRRRKADGVCVDCPAPVCDGCIRCAYCLDRRRVRQNEKRAELIAAGLCMSCRKPRGKDGTAIHCRPHADWASTLKWQRKARLRARLPTNGTA